MKLLNGLCLIGFGGILGAFGVAYLSIRKKQEPITMKTANYDYASQTVTVAHLRGNDGRYNDLMDSKVTLTKADLEYFLDRLGGRNGRKKEA